MRVQCNGTMRKQIRNCKMVIWKKYILTKIFILTCFWGAFATAQSPTTLVYNGDTISVYLSLLPDEFYKIDSVTIDSDNKYINRILTVNLFGEKEGCRVTSCWADFRATWEIEKNQLYLTGIYSCCYYEDSIKADLTALFKEKVINGKVKADWISSDNIVRGGKEMMFFYHEIPVFKQEFEFNFLKGKLISVKTFDNSKSRMSMYSQDNEKLANFIYSNIDWDNLPKQQMPLRVITRFVANEDGKIDKVEILKKNDNEIFNQEAIRVIKLIPAWDVIFNRGQFIRNWFIMPITFSEKVREKYSK